MSKNLINIMAGAAAAAVLAFGAWAIGKSSASSDNTADAAPAAQVGGGNSAGRAPWSGALMAQISICRSTASARMGTLPYDSHRPSSAW